MRPGAPPPGRKRGEDMRNRNIDQGTQLTPSEGRLTRFVGEPVSQRPGLTVRLGV